jgi:hypothetical protein
MVLPDSISTVNSIEGLSSSSLFQSKHLRSLLLVPVMFLNEADVGHSYSLFGMPVYLLRVCYDLASFKDVVNKQTWTAAVWKHSSSANLNAPYDGPSSRHHRELKKKLNSLASVRERTIPTERPPPVGEVSANFADKLKLRFWTISIVQILSKKGQNTTFRRLDLSPSSGLQNWNDGYSPES